MKTRLLVNLCIPGPPATAGSKTIGRTKDGRTFIRPANKRQKPWMETVRAEASLSMRDQELSRGPITLEVEVRLARPKNHYRTGKHAGEVKPTAPRFPTGKPDLTKIVRAVEDALTGTVWRDDAQVVHQGNDKGYAWNGKPVTRITVYEWVDDATDESPTPI